MYYESYCDYVVCLFIEVYLNHSFIVIFQVSYNVEKDMQDALEIFKRNNKKRRFDEILDKEVLTQKCH